MSGNYINRTYRRSGTLWEGRYKSTLVESSKYCLACYRYIEMNPVRAGMVDSPPAYPWSSYRFNAEGDFERNLTPHDEYIGLGNSSLTRQKAYGKLFEAPFDNAIIEEIRATINSNYILGNDRFKDEIEHHLKCRVRPGKSGRPRTTS